MKHLLAERYMLEEPIGHGPVATVWRARDQSTGETLAVKVFARHVSADPYTVERFQRERYTLTAFLHTAYVRVRDIIAKEGVIALVTELVVGVDLHQYLDRNGPMAPPEAVEVAATIAEALAAGHDAGVVHSGIKPTNIMLEESGQVRVTDSRVGRLAYSQDHTVRGRVGAEYQPPETVRGGPPLSATDVYALGVLLVEMLTGTPVAPQPTLHANSEGRPRSRYRFALPTSIPNSLRPLIRSCLSADPSARPTMRELAAYLRRMHPSFDEERDEMAGHTPPPRHRRFRFGGGGRHDDDLAPYSVEQPVRSRGDRIRRELPGRTKAMVAGAAVLVVAAGVTAVLATRDGDDEAAPPPPTSTGDISRSSQSGLAPPPTAGPATVEGAAAFTTYWFDALSHAIGTGTTGPLQDVSTPDCDQCNAAIRLARDAYRDGGSLRGGSYLVHQTIADAFWNPDQPRLGVIFDRSPRSTVRADGSLTAVLPPAAFARVEVVLSRVGGRWQMRQVLAAPDAPFV
jgi:eukaryotic-like serine/threonine-protein kinase